MRLCEAIEALCAGKIVTCEDWMPNQFIYLGIDKEFRDENEEKYEFNGSDVHHCWQIYEQHEERKSIKELIESSLKLIKEVNDRLDAYKREK